MSTYDDSSLFLYPSGYKASVLFAQKPMDANGQLAFTRSNDTATRVASNGLIEKVRTNLATYSEQFNNAAWSKQEITVTANAAVAPDGTQSADKLIPTAVTSTHQITSATLTTLTQCAFSVFAKADGYNTITILDLSVASNGATFNVETGTVSTIFGTATASIVPYGNGWYRCIVVANTTGVRFYIPTSASNFTGDGTSGVLLWGAQVEAGDIATDYIATTTTAVSVGPVANIPRIDYLGGGCGKLLLEPQATALNQFSESFDNAYWIKNDVTISANTTETLDPAGYYGADKVVETATPARHRVAAGSTTISAANHTASVFMKKGTARYGFVTFSGAAVSTIVVDLENGTITSTSTSGTIVAQKVENYGSGWYRISVTALGTATTTTYTLQFGSAGSATPSYTSNIPSFTGSTSNYLYAWGANLTATSYLQSYIPTLAASVTRGADACSKTGISSLIGQTEGTLFVDFIYDAANTANERLTISDGTSAERIYFIITTTGLIGYNATDGSTDQWSISSTLTVGQRYKIAGAYKANDVVFYINGVQIGTDTSATIPTCSNLYFANENGSTQEWNNPMNQLLLFKTRLPNSELAALTAL